MNTALTQQLNARLGIQKAFNGPVLSFMLRYPLEFARLKYIQYFKKSGLHAFATFWGDTMYGVMPEQVTNILIRHGFHEEGLTRIFLEYVKPGMRVFDIGAHFGYFTLLASHLATSAGRVYAFEPTKSTFEVLQRNSRPNTQLENTALFSSAGEVEFKDYGAAFSAFNSLFGAKIPGGLEPKTIKVKTMTLDAYCAAGIKPDFIKIDAEHAELDILKGGEQTIKKHRPMITLEVGDYGIGSPSRESVAFLLERGYRALEFSGGKVVPHTIKEKYTYENILFVPI